MSTKNTTTSTNKYDPTSLATYRSLQGPSANMQSGFINNPYNNSTYNAQRSMGAQLNTAGAAGRAATSANQAGALGTTGSSQIGLGMSNNLTNSMMSGRTNNALMIGAAGLRQQALGAAMNYRPLQTGGTQVQSTGGLGTWLAPLVGAGMAGASGFFGKQSNPGSGPGGTGPDPDPSATGDAMYGFGNPFSAPSAAPSGGGGSGDVWGLG